jgi:hypothetical protein
MPVKNRETVGVSSEQARSWPAGRATASDDLEPDDHALIEPIDAADHRVCQYGHSPKNGHGTIPMDGPVTQL